MDRFIIVNGGNSSSLYYRNNRLIKSDVDTLIEYTKTDEYREHTNIIDALLDGNIADYILNHTFGY